MPKIVGIGEILWDLLPCGREIGGAPANFICHAQSLGAEACLVSRVGDDAPGKEILSRLEQQGITTRCISSDAALPTGSVSVEIRPGGQAAYRIHEGVAWDALEATPAAVEAVASADALCFGTLAQRMARSRKTVMELVAASRPEALRIFDVNLRQEYFTREILRDSLEAANAVKLNDEELPVVAALLEVQGGWREQLTTLAKRYGLGLVAYTRGAKGSVLLRGGEWSEHPGVTGRVVDTIGAGDSFTAAIALGFLQGWRLAKMNAVANEVGAFVCSRSGATPPLPAEIRNLFRSGGPQTSD